MRFYLVQFTWLLGRDAGMDGSLTVVAKGRGGARAQVLRHTKGLPHQEGPGAMIWSIKKVKPRGGILL